MRRHWAVHTHTLSFTGLVPRLAVVVNATPRRARPIRQARPSQRRWLLPPALALFVCLASLFILTSGGHTYSYDEETMFALTESLAERGSVEIPNCGGCAIIPSDPAPGGHSYSRYGPLQSLAALPLYLLGRGIAGEHDAARWFTTRFFASLLNALITPAIAALLYWLVRQLGYGVRIGLATALVYGLGTQAWPHAKTFFAEPLTTLCLLGAVYCWWRLDQLRQEVGVTAEWRWAAGLGLCCGLAMATKWGAAIALPTLGLATAFTLWRNWRQGAPLPRTCTVGVVAALGLAAPVALVLAYNYARYADPFETGYGAAEVGAIQSGGFWLPLAALLISPGKGIFLFSPVVALALPAWPLFFRRHRALALVAAGLSLTHLLFYARVPTWPGGTAWGPRFLDFVVPLLVLPLCSGLAWLARQQGWRRRALTVAGALVLGAALVVQLLGVLVNFDTAFNAVTAGRRYWDWPNAPVYLHARILGERVAAWSATRWPRADAVVPGAGFVLLNEDDPPWPRFLPAVAQLRVHAAGDTPLTGALIYEDARARREPPSQPVVLVNGRSVAAREEPAPEVAPAAYRLTFPIRAAGERHDDFTVTLRNDHFAQLGPSRLLAFSVWRDGAALPVRPRPLLLPFPADSPERWAWFFTARNQHLIDLWPWYVVVARLPSALTRQLLVGVGGGALLGLFVGSAVLLAGWRRQVTTRR